MSDVGVARILERKAKAEEQFGSKEKALESRNKAIAAYEMLIMLGVFSDAQVRIHIEDAYHECVPLLLKTGKWQNVIEDCDRYVKLFSNGRYMLDMRKWKNEAKMKIVTEHVAEHKAEPEEKESAGNAP